MSPSPPPSSPPPAGSAGSVPVVVLQSKLRSLPVADRLRLSLLVLLLGAGYCAGFAYIMLTTIPAGEELFSTQLPGWVAAKYHGTGVPKLIAKVSKGGTMAEHLAEPETTIPILQAWYDAKMPEAEWDKIHKIFNTTGPKGKSCLECHCRYDADGEEGKKHDAPLEKYADALRLMNTDRMPTATLVRLSHFHLVGMALMAFGFTWVWMQTAFRNPVRGIFMVLPFAAIATDIGGWWLTWLHPAFTYVVLLGGALYGISSVVLTVGPLYDMWLRRCSPGGGATPPGTPPPDASHHQESAP